MNCWNLGCSMIATQHCLHGFEDVVNYTKSASSFTKESHLKIKLALVTDRSIQQLNPLSYCVVQPAM
jgi:hypothetical protein